MKLIRCQTPNEVAAKTLEVLRRIAIDELTLFVPTGSTPRPIYAAMAQEAAFWRACLRPVQIDEFIDDRRIFYDQLRVELLEPLALGEKALLIDPRWTEVQMFEHIDRVLKRPIHCALLGLGPNGHVGFHEPGCPMNFVGGRVQVCEESRVRVAGADTNQAYTFGVQAFMRAQEVVMVVTGESKRQILKSVLGSGRETEVPGAFLKNHKHLTIISDVLD